MFATQLGSLPGTDFAAALRLVRDTLPAQLAIPELPDRGPEASLVGRGAALLDSLAVELQPTGWRLTDRPSRDQRRARAMLRDDLDRTEEELGADDGADRPPMKISVAGPWTLAAAIELPRGELVLADPGAVRELSQSLGQGIDELAADLVRRFGPRWVIQLDEPSLPGVAGGTVPTASGLHRHRRRDPAALVAGLQPSVSAIRERGAVPALHCCAPGLDLDVARRAQIDVIALDAGLVDGRQFEQLGHWLEDGRQVYWGVQPTAPGDPVLSIDQLVDRYRGIVRTLGLDPELIAAASALTPACGLAGWQPLDVSRALRHLDRAAELAPEATADR